VTDGQAPLATHSPVDGHVAGSTPILSVHNLVVHYGQIQALDGVSLDVHPGEIIALIGSNGAGKSTTLRAISGLVRPTSGTIVFEDQNVAGLPSHRIVRLGLVHVPEGRQVFANQSVRDNLILGAYQRPDDRKAGSHLLERELDRFPVLRERQHQLAGTLSGGEQQMLAISRGLMARPKVLLLDEPSMGLAPLLVKQVAETVTQLNAEGVTVLLVEQMATMALSVAHRAYVIQNGRVVLEGPSASVARDPEVVRAYLGGAQTDRTAPHP
jgi:branched-chain amino acid transport system ATP-binding protein